MSENEAPAGAATPPVVERVGQIEYDPKCPKCGQHIPVLMMCGADGMPLPAGPGGGPIVLIPDKCPRCGHRNFTFSTGAAPTKLWTPSAGSVGGLTPR